MSEVALTGSEVMAWNHSTAEKWRVLVEAKPELLALPCDIYKTQTVGELLRHVVAVELRYAQRLSGVPETPYEALGFGSAEEIFAVHVQAMTMIRALLGEPEYPWETEMEFATISMGRLKASRRTLLFHVLLHSIRHYAQLATLVRQHGFTTGFAMDYLMMGAQPA